jgi:hypothetical protein
MAASFKHQPLNQAEVSIRLLKVLPDSPPDTIHCDLQHATVDASYICLSYVWGSSVTQHKILINNAEFWVWSNLWDFLCVAKEEYSLTTFWIDAICIDQSCISERNHQVSMMGHIYSRAKRVIAWLGHDERMVAFARAWSRRWTLLSEPTRDILGSSMGAWGALSGSDIIGAYNLVTNEYWSRAWV